MIGEYLHEALEHQIFNISSLSVVGFSTGAHVGSAIGQTIYQMSGNLTKLPRFHSINCLRDLDESQSCSSISE